MSDRVAQRHRDAKLLALDEEAGGSAPSMPSPTTFDHDKSEASCYQRSLLVYRRSPRKLVFTAVGVLLATCLLLIAFAERPRVSGAPQSVVADVHEEINLEGHARPLEPKLERALPASPVPCIMPSVAPTVAMPLSPPPTPSPPVIPLPFAPLPFDDLVARQRALPAPHGGGSLVDLTVSEERAAELASDIASGGIQISWTLTQRQACDIELLLSGGFTPLDGFMTADVYASVVATKRLGPGKFNDALWPMPIVLDVPAAFVAANADVLEPLRSPPASGVPAAAPVPARIALRDAYHNLIAVLTATSVYAPDKPAEARAVFGTVDPSHPGVAYLLEAAGDVYIGGTLEGLALPKHFDFPDIRLTPAQVRATIVERGWPRTVAFQTRNPMHRAHIELTKLASVEAGAGLLLHPSVGMTKPGDVEASVRVRCYQAVVAGGRHYAPGGVILSLLPLAMRMAGPVEALWHAIIRKNHGASHFVVGRDHAGCKDARGNDFYAPYEAQELVTAHAADLGITLLKYSELEYVPRLDQYLAHDAIPAGEAVLSISGTKFRALMNRGDAIPDWYSDRDVIAILRQLMPPLHARGFALLFTGLSGGGKTTIAHGLMQRLGGLVPTRRVTFLDGDLVRVHLSRGLGFTLLDRNANVERIGWVAAEAAKHGAIVVAAPIAPLAEARRSFRKHVASTGNSGFFQVYVSSSLAVCAARDVKGLYELAAAGRTDLTGVSHPYEVPDADTDLVLDTARTSVDDAVAMIVAVLVDAGYLDGASLAADLTPAEAALVAALGARSAAKATAKGKGKGKGEGKGNAAPVAVADAPATATAAASSRLLPYFVSGAVDVTAQVSAAVKDPSAAFCRADWDAMQISRHVGGRAVELQLFGGLPMQASLAAAAVLPEIHRDANTSSIVDPPAALVVGVAHGAMAQLLRLLTASATEELALVAAEAGRAQPAPFLIQGLSSRYIAAAEAVAAVAAADEKAAKGLIAQLLAGAGAGHASLPLTSPVDYEHTPSGAASAVGEGGAMLVSLAASLRDVDLDLSALSPLSSKQEPLPQPPRLTEGARVHAAWDLWTHMRWHWHALQHSPADAAAAPAAAAAAEEGSLLARRPVAFFSSSPRVLQLLPHLLRFDPCARVVVLLPAAAPPSNETAGAAGAKKSAFNPLSSPSHLHAFELAVALAISDASSPQPASTPARLLLEEAPAAAAAFVPRRPRALARSLPPIAVPATPLPVHARHAATESTPSSQAAAQLATPGTPSAATNSTEGAGSEAPKQHRSEVVAKSNAAAAPTYTELLESAARIHADFVLPQFSGASSAVRSIADAFPGRVLVLEITDTADMAWALQRFVPDGDAAAGDDVPAWARRAIDAAVQGVTQRAASQRSSAVPAGFDALRQRLNLWLRDDRQA